MRLVLKTLTGCRFVTQAVRNLTIKLGFSKSATILMLDRYSTFDVVDQSYYARLRRVPVPMEMLS